MLSCARLRSSRPQHSSRLLGLQSGGPANTRVNATRRNYLAGALRGDNRSCHVEPAVARPSDHRMKSRKGMSLCRDRSFQQRVPLPANDGARDAIRG